MYISENHHLDHNRLAFWILSWLNKLDKNIKTFQSQIQFMRLFLYSNSSFRHSVLWSSEEKIVFFKKLALKWMKQYFEISNQQIVTNNHTWRLIVCIHCIVYLMIVNVRFKKPILSNLKPQVSSLKKRNKLH